MLLASATAHKGRTRRPGRCHRCSPRGLGDHLLRMRPARRRPVPRRPPFGRAATSV